jgi:hypothetical protein
MNAVEGAHAGEGFGDVAGFEGGDRINTTDEIYRMDRIYGMGV